MRRRGAVRWQGPTNPGEKEGRTLPSRGVVPAHCLETPEHLEVQLVFCWMAAFFYGSVEWAVSRQRRNRAMHALHGNGPGRGVAPAAQARGKSGGQGGGRLDARQLQEPQLASKLRAAGWTLPAEVADTVPVRVYDTRLQGEYLRKLMADIGPGGPMICVGGDFITQPALDDGVALERGRLRPWGTGDGPSSIVVPPRPHLAVWLERMSSATGG